MNRQSFENFTDDVIDSRERERICLTSVKIQFCFILNMKIDKKQKFFFSSIVQKNDGL